MSEALARKLLAACRVTEGRDFALAIRSTKGEAEGLEKGEGRALLAERVTRLAALQDRMAAQDRHAVLAIFQGMDAAGKDSAIKHVFSGLNPQGCMVHAFKTPGPEELDHDFLRRHVLQLPARGRIGIHNRSWYEEVLIARVHHEVLARQRLPAHLLGPHLWEERLEDIAAFERYLGRQGTAVVKFFLHLGREEQRQRFLARIDEPDKNWKLEPADIAERRHWDRYQQAYEAAIRATATPAAPWYVVPADRKWLARLIVVEAMLETLEAFDPRYPEASPETEGKLDLIRRQLMEEDGA